MTITAVLTEQEKWEYVKKAWENVYVDEYGNVRIISKEGFARLAGNLLKSSVHAAYEFTQERNRQKAEVKEEIEDLRAAKFPLSIRSVRRPKDRILAREQAALADLRRGMKEQK